MFWRKDHLEVEALRKQAADADRDREAARLNLPFLGELPLDLAVRVAGDAGTPIAAGEGPMAQAYMALAARLVAGGMA